MSRFIEELAAKVVVSKSVLALPARLKERGSKQNVQGGKVQKLLEKNGIEVRGNRLHRIPRTAGQRLNR